MADLSALEKQYGLPMGLLTAVMQAESGGNPKAVSPAGAQGLFQFMPQTAKAYGIDPLDPEQAAIGAARMYGDLSKQYGGNVDKMLAAYNWGSGNLAKMGMEKAPQETIDYISKVKAALPKQYADAGNVMTDAQIDAEIAALEADTSDIDAEIAALESELGQQPATKEVPLDTSMFATVGDQFLQMATLGYGDEAQAYLASLAGVPYEEALKVARGNLQAQREENPTTSMLAGLVGGIGGGAGLARLAPGAAGKLASMATTSPYKTAAATGATMGAIQGTGMADENDSLTEAALLGGTVGGLAGAGGAYLARNVVAPIAEKLGISQKLSKLAKFATARDVKAVTPSKSGALEGEIEAINNPVIAAPVAKEGELFAKTAGQRTQDPAIQRLESEARANLITPEANRQILAADVAQNRQYRDFVGKLAGKIDESTDVNAMVEGIGNTVQTRAGEAMKSVRSAYDLASKGKGVKIGIDDIRQGLWGNIVNIRREGAYDLSQMPQAKAVVKRLAGYSKGGLNRITSVKLGEMENWRKQVTNAIQSSGDASEKNFLRNTLRSYDDFMQQTADNAVDIGDKEAINAFKRAVASRREYGRLYESNTLVEKLAKGELSVDDARKTLIGSGAIKGKAGMADNAKAIIKAAGDDADNVKADLRQAFIRKAVDRATSGFEPGNPDMPMISAAKLKTELEGIFNAQSDFAKEVFGKDAVAEAKQAIKELTLITSKQASTQNVSGSGELLGRMLKLAGRVPVVGKPVAAIQSVTEAGARQQQAQKVTAGLTEFMDELKKPPLSGKWALAGSDAGRAAVMQGQGEEVGGEIKREPLRLTITPRKEK